MNWMQNSEAKKLLAIVENRFPKAEKAKNRRPLLERMFSKKVKYFLVTGFSLDCVFV